MKLILFYVLRLFRLPMPRLTVGFCRPMLTLLTCMMQLSVGGLELAHGQQPQAEPEAVPTLNLKADGFRGIWYMNQPSNDEYVYKWKTWQNAQGLSVPLPLTTSENPALVRDYRSEGLNVYLKDLRYDSQDRPILLYVTSKGYQSGPQNDPRTWTVARWDGREWLFSSVTTSDNNYDMGELWLVGEDDWRIYAPTEPGPQAYNPGGEVAFWQSTDQGKTWKRIKQLTLRSERNHTYVRRVLNAHPDFVALWADGHGRRPSESRLYFCDLQGDVFMLPPEMEADRSSPIRVNSKAER